MAKVSNTDDKATKRIRWIARGLGSLAAAYSLLMGIGYGITEPGPLTGEGAMMAVLITTSVVGVIVAWWREGTGGTILVVDAIAYGIFAFFAAGHNKGLAVSITAGPWLLIGSLFIASWRRSGETMPPP
ncbi:MAG: hypothetical protein ABIK79_03620 [Chloroflexota bacterium]|nr:hypothetical protein [Anaerolineae bacterium]